MCSWDRTVSSIGMMQRKVWVGGKNCDVESTFVGSAIQLQHEVIHSFLVLQIHILEVE